MKKQHLALPALKEDLTQVPPASPGEQLFLGDASGEEVRLWMALLLQVLPHLPAYTGGVGVHGLQQ